MPLDRGGWPSLQVEADRVTQAEAIRTVAAMPKLEFKPGSRWAYSNSNYLLLGEIVRRLQAAVSGAVETKMSGGRLDGRYGAGVLQNPDGSLTHPGQWIGFETEFWVSADRHTSVALSCNLRGFSVDGLRSVLVSIWTSS